MTSGALHPREDRVRARGLRFKVRVPDEVDFKLEVEIGDDEREIEIALTW